MAQVRVHNYIVHEAKSKASANWSKAICTMWLYQLGAFASPKGNQTNLKDPRGLVKVV